MLPNKLQHGDNLANLFEKFNTVIDYLREIRLVAGNGIRINRLPAGTTIESTAAASGSPPSPPESRWHCDVSEEDGTITVKVTVRRPEDNNVTLTFRGRTYGVDSETFTMTRSDLASPIYLYFVKIPYGPDLAFRIVPSHKYLPSESGCVKLAEIYLRDDAVRVDMIHDRLFDWTDSYPGNGRFAADLMFSGIIHNDDEPQPIPFYEFTTTAEQKLGIIRNYALLVNGVYVIGTRSGGDGHDVISIRPTGLETAAIRVFWAADVSYPGGGKSNVSNIRYEVTGTDGDPYAAQPGTIRIPVVSLSELSESRPLRSITHNFTGIPNVPELDINPFGQDLNASKCGWVYVDHTARKVGIKLILFADGVWLGSPEMNIPFSVFSNAGSTGQELVIAARYNIETHRWGNYWFTFNGNPITSYTPPTDKERDYGVQVALIAWNSEAGFPYVVGQNFSRVIHISNSADRFSELLALIEDLDERVTNLESRVTNLESRS